MGDPGIGTVAATTDEAVVGARAWQILLITSVSIFLVAMDVTIVSVALPGIRDSFDEPANVLAWVFTAYNITFAALLLVAGKLGDRWGHREAFLGGVAAVRRRLAHRRGGPERRGADRRARASRRSGAR